jgi:hypothetical protein
MGAASQGIGWSHQEGEIIGVIGTGLRELSAHERHDLFYS